MPDPGPFDAAVIIPTALRPSLIRAVRSVFNQDIAGRVQILIGVDDDGRDPGRKTLSELQAHCPDNMMLTVLDPGYSTSQYRGGIYPVRSGGALRTAMSYLANSERVAYLDDDNWWAHDHLSSLLAAIEGFDWAFSLRWYVHPHTLEPMGVDLTESVGPGKGYHKARFNGFVDTNCLMIDKMRCHWALPAWTVPAWTNPQTNIGEGVDRSIFQCLRENCSVSWTNRATAYYVVNEPDIPIVEGFLAQQEMGQEKGRPAMDRPSRLPSEEPRL